MLASLLKLFFFVLHFGKLACLVCDISGTDSKYEGRIIYHIVQSHITLPPSG